LISPKEPHLPSTGLDPQSTGHRFTSFTRLVA